MINRRTFLQSSAAAAAFAASASSARADNAPGVTDTEIKIGQTMPYSGPASAYGVIGRTEAAYFKMINDQGGINGRKINFISLDDAYSPPKTVEQVRRLVEDEKVAFLFQTLGTPPNLAIRQYLNDNKVPQLFVATGASVFSDPQHFHWTIGYQAGRQDRRPLPERRFRQGLPDRTQGCTRRGSRRHDREGGFLRDLRTNGRFASGDVAGLRRRHFAYRRNAKVRRAGDP
jgi:branched-chain amino acid transport system substrate-binding protein